MVGVVGAQGQLTQGPNVPNPSTKYKRSKNVFAVTFIALIIGRDWPRLVQPLAQSLIGSPGTLGAGKGCLDEFKSTIRAAVKIVLYFSYI